jgi:hypothetical protein
VRNSKTVRPDAVMRTYKGFTYPPKPLAFLLGAETLAVLVLFVVATDLANLVGYIVGAWLAAGTGVWYRYLDRSGRRETPATYRPQPVLNKVVVGLVGACWVLALGHAWFLTQTTALAA